jgi:hypothetical protein
LTERKAVVIDGTDDDATERREYERQRPSSSVGPMTTLQELGGIDKGGSVGIMLGWNFHQNRVLLSSRKLDWCARNRVKRQPAGCGSVEAQPAIPEGKAVVIGGTGGDATGRREYRKGKAVVIDGTGDDATEDKGKGWKETSRGRVWYRLAI